MTQERALTGKRIVVTRPAHQAGDLAVMLAQRGAVPLLCPMLEIVPPADPRALPQAIAGMDRFDYAFFTSANGAEAFLATLDEHRLRLSGLHAKMVAVGQKTAAPLRARDLLVSVYDNVRSVEDLLDAVAPEMPGARAIVFQGDTAESALADGLRKAGAVVTRVEAYRMRMPADAAQCVRNAMLAKPDAITFASALSAQNFFTTLNSLRLKMPHRTVIASIGGVTTRALTDLGHPPDVQPTRPDLTAVVTALTEHFAAH